VIQVRTVRSDCACVRRLRSTLHAYCKCGMRAATDRCFREDYLHDLDPASAVAIAWTAHMRRPKVTVSITSRCWRHRLRALKGDLIWSDSLYDYSLGHPDSNPNRRVRP